MIDEVWFGGTPMTPIPTVGSSSMNIEEYFGEAILQMDGFRQDVMTRLDKLESAVAEIPKTTAQPPKLYSVLSDQSAILMWAILVFLVVLAIISSLIMIFRMKKLAERQASKIHNTRDELQRIINANAKKENAEIKELVSDLVKQVKALEKRPLPMDDSPANTMQRPDQTKQTFPTQSMPQKPSQPLYEKVGQFITNEIQCGTEKGFKEKVSLQIDSSLELCYVYVEPKINRATNDHDIAMTSDDRDPFFCMRQGDYLYIYPNRVSIGAINADTLFVLPDRKTIHCIVRPARGKAKGDLIVDIERGELR